MSEDFKVHDNFFTLSVSWGIGRSNPVVCNRTVRKNAGVEICGFAGSAIEPEAGCNFHSQSVLASALRLGNFRVLDLNSNPSKAYQFGQVGPMLANQK